jgi:uncharacterized membrane protein YidH (DUF202 family)
MNNKWIINKLAVVLVALTVIFGLMRYYRWYDFNISMGDRLLFWVPDAIVGIVGIIIFVLTYKAKKNET